jgi:capsular polysaccharide export protein
MLTFSSGIAGIRHIQQFLEAPIDHAHLLQRLWPLLPPAQRYQAVVGWGCKDNTQSPRRWATRYGLPFWSLESGFVRSLDIGHRDPQVFSLVLDRQGIFYDATRPSDLELALLAPTAWETPSMLADAQAAMAFMRQRQITKYNLAFDRRLPRLLEQPGPKVLLVDQTYQDMSVRYGMADATSFARMLDTALRQHPTATIYAKLHPETVDGVKAGYLAGSIAAHPEGRRRVRLLTERVNPMAALPLFSDVYTVSSQLGFEALLMGCRVHCFGLPFYAGWGLTQDALPCPRRQPGRSLETVFAAAYLHYPRYLNPLNGQPNTLMDTLHLIDYLRRLNQENTGRIFCLGFPLWKHARIRRFLQASRNQVVFVRTVAEARKRRIDKECKLYVWGSPRLAGLETLANEIQRPVGRIEDGFIRSIGLGSDLCRPQSLVVDPQGIYYDPRQPSLLETLLATHPFEPALLQRARRLRELVVAHGLSKYNLREVDSPAPNRPAAAGDRPVLLVIGQVEGDASLRAGAPVWHSNQAFLAEVRRQHPEGYLLYKPHPDVLAGNKPGHVPKEALAGLCNAVVGGDLPAWLPHVDALHTMTSLAGFEALLRQTPVVTYGMPFYAGWGLTQDNLPMPWRTRRLCVDALFAAVMLLYPRYYNWQAKNFDTPEACIQAMMAALTPSATRQAWPQGRRARQLYRYVSSAFESWAEAVASGFNPHPLDNMGYPETSIPSKRSFPMAAAFSSEAG